MVISSKKRSTPIFIYSANTLNFVTLIYGNKTLSEYLKVNLNTKRIAKAGSMYTFDTAVRHTVPYFTLTGCQDIVISLKELSEESIKEKITKGSLSFFKKLQK